MYKPNFDERGHTVADSNYETVGFVSPAGIFRLQNLEAVFNYQAREHISVDDLIKREKAFYSDITNMLSMDTHEFFLYKGTELDIDNLDMLEKGFDGNAVADVLLRAFYYALGYTVNKPGVIQEMPDYVISGKGAEGRVLIDKEDKKIVIKEELIYTVHFLYIDEDNAMPIDGIKSVTDMVLTPAYEVKEPPIDKGLEVFEDFLDNLDLPDET